MEDGWMDEWIYRDLDTAVYINTGYFGSYKMRMSYLLTCVLALQMSKGLKINSKFFARNIHPAADSGFSLLSLTLEASAQA